MMRVLMLVLGLGIAASSLVQSPEDKVVFLDVGQGDSILLQSGSKQILIDGGPGMAVLEKLGEEMPWFDRRIDVVVLTHPQRDHMEGLLHVLDRYEVGMVLLPHVSHTSLMQAAWLERIERTGVPYRFAWEGQRLELGDLEMHVLGPFDSAAASAAAKADLNNASVMVRADFHDMSFLLTGDAEKRVERMLVGSTDARLLDVDVLKAGHHGSKTSNTAELIAAASPATFVVSAGEDNRFGHPHESVLERVSGLPVWRTDQHGSVRFEYEGGQWLAAGR